MPGDRARKAVKNSREYAEGQTRGTVRNTRRLVDSFAFDRVLPSGVRGFIQELLMLIPRSLGRGTAIQQVYASATLIIIAIIATPVSLGYSLILAVPAAITLVIGGLRMVPQVNSAYARVRGNRLRDRDVPLWQRD